MILIALLLVAISVAVGLAHAARRRPLDPREFRIGTAVLAGGLIAAVRLGVFWSALGLYTEHADSRQVAGYVMLILNSVLELSLAAALSGRPGAPWLVAGLIVLTSAVLGWAWAWIRFRRVALSLR